MADSQSFLGQTISHYRIVEKLGAGGMGEVYRAHDEQLDRDVALKVLPAGTLADDAARKQFRKEALALAKLNHPNIETVFEFSSHGGMDFLAMELIAGSLLSERLKEGPLPAQEIQRLGIQFAEALASAHDQGVIHRDLKPGNLFLTLDGHLKILDFGLATIIHPEWGTDVTQSTAANSTTISGTVPYMSPEQLRGLPVDARSDIYAAGAVLYEMATGQRPFPQSQSAELVGAILHQTPPPPRSLNSHVSPGLEAVICKSLEKEPQRRYQSARELLVALEAGTPSAAARLSRHSRWPWVAGAALTVVGVALGGWFYFAHQAHALSATDTVVLADFANSTGDPVFDEALKQAVTVQLAQSPFLNILPDQSAREQLRFMGRAPGDRVTLEVAQEICQRTGSKAVLAGSIARLGSQYVIGFKAVNCQTGASLAEVQDQAPRKEDVLKALGGESTRLRERLGESLSSIQRFDVPIPNVTTSSLEALKDISLGVRMFSEKGDSAAVPFFKHAIELDPKFALAYALLGSSYTGLGENSQAKESYTRAYELRDRVSEQEKFAISAYYYSTVTGELEKANQTLELWSQTYPRAASPHFLLSSNYALIGLHEKALAESLEGIRLNPAVGVEYGNLMFCYTSLNRLAEAKAVYPQVLARHLDAPFFHVQLYTIAFLEGDAAEMKQQLAWSAGKPVEDSLVSSQSDSEAFYGHLGKARELLQHAVEIAQRGGEKETAAGWQMDAALRDAEFGNPAQAREKTTSALALAATQEVQTEAALAFARAGDSARARKITEDLARQFPTDALLNRYWLPTLRAAIEINRHNPGKAIDLLQAVAPYDLGEAPPLAGTLYPVYIRGQAYLLLHQGNEAAAEFQKFLDHRGIVTSFPLGALAHLGLARAYVLQGDTAKARTAYQDFLTLWKEADSDIPILKQAKAEYAKLQ